MPSISSSYISFKYKQRKAATAVQLSNGVLAYLLDIPTVLDLLRATSHRQPNVTPNQHVFVVGPYLVRSASVSSEPVPIVRDNANAATHDVYAGSSVAKISWNAQELPTTKTSCGNLTTVITGTQDSKIELPDLINFKVADSAPEISPLFDDRNWIAADKNKL